MCPEGHLLSQDRWDETPLLPYSLHSLMLMASDALIDRNMSRDKSFKGHRWSCHSLALTTACWFFSNSLSHSLAVCPCSSCSPCVSIILCLCMSAAPTPRQTTTTRNIASFTCHKLLNQTVTYQTHCTKTCLCFDA